MEENEGGFTMKKLKKILFILPVLVMCLSITIPVSAAVKISSKNVTLTVGQKKQLEVTGTTKKVKWSSNKKKVATIDQRGVVTAKSAGTAKIAAKVGSKKYTCTVKVKKAAKIALNKTKLTLNVGQSYILKLKNAGSAVSWGCNDSGVAMIFPDGTVTGMKAGSCTITATYGEKKYTCKVTVKQSSGGPTTNPSTPSTPDTPTTPTKPSKVPVVSFSLSYYETRIKEGESEKIETYIYPENATNKTVKWSSSNTAVATVDSYGNVTGKSIGEAVITAVCDGKTSTCGVKVIRNFIEQEATNSVTYQTYRTKDGVVVTAKNNYKYSINLHIDCIYYDEYGVMIGKNSDNCNALGVGRECALLCGNPYDSNYHDVSYSSFKINIKASDADVIDNSSAIVCVGNFGYDNVMVNATNMGQQAEYTQIAVVYYKSGQVIGYGSHYANVENPGSTDYLQFDFPYDEEYNTIHPDNFKVYVNSSYRYDWS